MAQNIDMAEVAADSARLRLVSSVDALKERLKPQQLMGDAMAATKLNSRQLLDKAGDQLRAHPLAIGAALAAVGLALVARNRISNAELDLGDDLAGYTDYDDGLVPPRAMAAYDDDGGYTAIDVPDADGWDDDAPVARRAPLAAVSGNPVLTIIAGLAAGAALGLLFPPSRGEQRLLQSVAGE
ncbi:MAG: hypothetical protein WCO82_05295 [Sphingomonadales bacterium]|jgi:hypothetical protein